jgi:hypothetical protein
MAISFSSSSSELTSKMKNHDNKTWTDSRFLELMDIAGPGKKRHTHIPYRRRPAILRLFFEHKRTGVPALVVAIHSKSAPTHNHAHSTPAHDPPANKTRDDLRKGLAGLKALDCCQGEASLLEHSTSDAMCEARPPHIAHTTCVVEQGVDTYLVCPSPVVPRKDAGGREFFTLAQRFAHTRTAPKRATCKIRFRGEDVKPLQP